MECIILELAEELYSSTSGVFFLLAAAISLWENFDKIKSKILYVSILVSVFLSVGALLLVFTLAAWVLNGGSLASATVITAIGTICWVGSWCSLTFHSATRTFMILFPFLRRPPVWVLSGLIVLIQLCISTSGAYFFVRSQAPDSTEYETASTLRITLVESIWFSSVESILFFATQFKIIRTIVEVKNMSNSSRTRRAPSRTSFSGLPRSLSLSFGKTPAMLYIKAALRSLFFSVNVVMVYLTIGGYFGSNKNSLSWSINLFLRAWSTNGLSIAVIILMTDAHRFQSALDLLHGEKIESSHGEDQMRVDVRSWRDDRGRGKVHPEEVNDIGSSAQEIPTRLKFSEAPPSS
ncbi:hypothetical protein BJ742DRAFT_778435 [Cladochytrium replicatum]|nr:hypothetical protein BJ742DRAFT_778435 [Cladochytrium replicatum]